jgi:uncharacterized protein (DUF58 family)
MKPVTNPSVDEAFLERQIQEIMERTVQAEIPVDWRSEQSMPSGGERKSLFKGDGQDFYEFDRYEPGYDEPRLIDWAATSKQAPLGPRGRDVIKSVKIEKRNIKFTCMVDVNTSMRFGTKVMWKYQLAAQVMASVMVSTEKQKDPCGLILFSKNAVEGQPLDPRSAQTNLWPALYMALITRATAAGATPEPGDGFANACHGLPFTKSVVFIISDFLNFSQNDWEALEEISVLHDVVCVYIQDERERKLPDPVQTDGVAGWFLKALDRFGWFITLDTGGERKTIFVNKKTRAQYAANWRQHEASVVKRLDEMGGKPQWLVVSTEQGDLAIPEIMALFLGHA